MTEIRLQGVTKRFGTTIPLDRVTATIRHGEFFGIVGPTGCGKTTLLRLISRFPIPASVEARS